MNVHKSSTRGADIWQVSSTRPADRTSAAQPIFASTGPTTHVHNTTPTKYNKKYCKKWSNAKGFIYLHIFWVIFQKWTTFAIIKIQINLKLPSPADVAYNCCSVSTLDIWHLSSGYVLNTLQTEWANTLRVRTVLHWIIQITLLQVQTESTLEWPMKSHPISFVLVKLFDLLICPKSLENLLCWF